MPFLGAAKFLLSYVNVNLVSKQFVFHLSLRLSNSEGTSLLPEDGINIAKPCRSHHMKYNEVYNSVHFVGHSLYIR
jgi:hypothetical protein